MKKYIISVLVLVFSLVVFSGCTNTSQKTQQNENTNITSNNELDKIFVGADYAFGSYEQDNDVSNGKESINWIVLEKSGNKLMLITEYALDAKEYNDTKTDVTWENCSLRTWLNNSFYEEAFSDEEKSLIELTTVVADENPDFSNNPGNNTEDKVFLLSKSELNKLNYSNKVCYMTPYCKSEKLEKSSGTFNGTDKCWWWLRGAGEAEQKVYHVNTDGGTDKYGFYKDILGVRPVIWIEVK